MNIVAVLGNGVSITYNPDFALVPLTNEILRRFAKQKIQAFEVQRRLSQLARAARPTDPDAPLLFEDLLGPFDRMADGIDAMRRLAPYVPGGTSHREELKSAARFGRRLFRRATGTALGVITEFSHNQGEVAWQRAGEVVNQLAVAAGHEGTVRIFTLNYDCLADSAALRLQDDLDSPVMVSDMADGRSQHRLQILKAGSNRRVLANPLRDDEEYLHGDCSIVIYHLHGAIDWVRDANGQVWKVGSVQQLRRKNFWRLYSRGLASVSPVVVLTDQKSAILAKDPFAWAYRRLRNALRTQDQLDAVLIAGYGFGDEPLNRVLADTLPDVGCPVFVVGRNDDDELLREQILGQLSVGGTRRARLIERLAVFGDGLPEALDRVDWP